MSRLPVLLLLAALFAPTVLAQTDGFLVTNAAGDTLFYTAPDGTVLFGPADRRVELGDGLEGFTSTVTGTEGSPSAGVFAIRNAANQGTALVGTTRGTGSGVSGWAYANGTAGGFYNYSESNPNPSLDAFTVGTGPGLRVKQLGGDLQAPLASFWSGVGLDGSSQTEVASIRADGHVSATSGEFQITDGANSGSVIEARTAGTGSAGSFFIDNAASTFSAVFGGTVGAGAGVYGRSTGAGSAVNGRTDGTGSAGTFTISNGANVSAAIFGDTNGANGGTGVHGRHTGIGSAVFGEQSGPGGIAGLFRISDAGNAASAVEGRTAGTGGAGSFFIDNPANSFSALFGRSNGTGAGVQGRNTGTGSSVIGIKPSLTGKAGEFSILNDDNDDFALDVFTQGGGTAVFGTATSGRGGQFLNVDPATSAPALEGVTYGTGVALRAIQNSGGGGTVADFVTADDYDNFNVVARIDTDGNVYADGTFNGGGADFAERFEVVGGPAAYEVGDVLAIATSADRHLERSAEPYSTRILGVYATRPGVLLGDPSISPETTVPVGVVGVVPTKVTGEGGPIRRGDMLVTSSTAGHAMRGEPGRVGVGMVIGKALQDFDGESGVIEVMVNVQ